MGSVGVAEIFIVLIGFGLFVLAPFLVLHTIAEAREAPSGYVLLGLLGWLGVIFGLFFIPNESGTGRERF